MSGSAAAGTSAAMAEAVTSANADVAARGNRRWSRRSTWFKSAFWLIIFCPPVSGPDVVSHATFSSSATVETRAVSRVGDDFSRLPASALHDGSVAGNRDLPD